jgi:hypothetical protein
MELWILQIVGFEVLTAVVMKSPISWIVCKTPCTGDHPSQGRYLHRTTQTQNKRRYPCLEWDSNPRSQWLSRWRYFVP